MAESFLAKYPVKAVPASEQTLSRLAGSFSTFASGTKAERAACHRIYIPDVICTIVDGDGLMLHTLCGRRDVRAAISACDGVGD